jgi:hypothetical protein
MRRRVETLGQVDIKGKVSMQMRDEFWENVKNWGECQIRIIAEKVYPKNSKWQRGYYWAVICQKYQEGAREEQGREISLEQAHEELKSNCSYEEYWDSDHLKVMRIINSSENDTAGREDYHEKCRRFIFEWFNITVPLPDPKMRKIK